MIVRLAVILLVAVAIASLIGRWRRPRVRRAAPGGSGPGGAEVPGLRRLRVRQPARALRPARMPVPRQGVTRRGARHRRRAADRRGPGARGWRRAAPTWRSTASAAARPPRRWPTRSAPPVCGRRCCEADLLDRPATAALVPAAAAALGRPLTVLVNNASIFERDTIATATWESWDRHIGSNLRAPFELIQAFAAQAPAAGRDAAGEPIARACVVNMIDQRVRKLTPEFATYTIAKTGLWTLTRTAAQGLAPDVRVNAIGPGPTLRGARQTEDAFRRAARRDRARPRRRPGGDRGGARLHPRRAWADRAAPLHRRRSASGVADPRRARELNSRNGSRLGDYALDFSTPAGPSHLCVDSVNDSRNLLYHREIVS